MHDQDVADGDFKKTFEDVGHPDGWRGWINVLVATRWGKDESHKVTEAKIIGIAGCKIECFLFDIEMGSQVLDRLFFREA